MLSRWNERLKNQPWAVGAFLALITVVTYWGALHDTFVYDDEPQILSNPFVLNPRLWTRIFTGSVWSFNSAIGLDNFYRPLQIFYYWLLYRLAGPNPGVFHFVQLVIYAASAGLVYRLGCEIFDHPCAAMVGAVLWILHPLHVEPVAWIAGFPDVGCGFFFLLAFLLFVRSEKNERPGLRSHFLGGLAYLPSVFFKETALSFPFLAVAYWFIVGSRYSASAARDWVARLYRLVPYLVSAGAYVAIRISVLGAFSKTPSLWKVSPRTLASALALLGWHSHLFVWPVGLSIFRTFDLDSSLRSPWPWAALLVLAVALLFRKRDAEMSFFLTWWAVALVPCLDIRQLSSPQVADRFSYIPSVGPCLALSLAFLVRLPARTAGRQPVRILAPAMALVMVFWASQTVLDVPHWRDKGTFMRYSMAQSPQAPALHIVQGDMLRFERGDLDGAEREYRSALSLNDNATVKSRQVVYDSYFGLGGVAQERGRNEQALSYYQQAAAVLPGLSPAYDALGALYFPQGDYATASLYFSRAVKANPQDVIAHLYLGNCWMKLARFSEAAQEFHAARTVDPSLKQAFVSEARALETLGHRDAAAQVRASYKNSGE